jgi:hypothetical protein
MHIIEQFNGGVYDTIIASEEKFSSETNDEVDNEKKDIEDSSINSKKSSKLPKR